MADNLPVKGGQTYDDIWKYTAQPGDTYVGVPNDYRSYQGTTMPYTPLKYQPPGIFGYPQTGQQPVYRSPTYRYDSLNNLTSIKGQQMAQLQGYLFQRGLLKAGSFHPGLYDAATAKVMNGLFQEANINGVSWQDVANANLINGPAFGAGGSGGGGGGGGGGGPKTIVQRQVTLTGRAGAFAALQQVLSQALGRDPTPQETQAFKRSLNAVETTNPTVTTTHYSAGGGSVNSTTKESDVNPQYEAYQAAQQGQLGAEGGRFQSNQYVEVLKNMLGM